MAKVENKKNLEFYQKKVNKRKLGGSLEYTTSNFAFIITAAIAACLVLWQAISILFFKTEISVLVLAVTGVFVVEAIVQFLVNARIIKEVTGSTGEITNGTRKLGILLMLFMLGGNFFMFIAGAMLIKKEKNTEYQLAIYSFLVTLLICVVSSQPLIIPKILLYPI